MGSIDHLVVAAASTEAGAAHILAALGRPPGPGGRHEAMGTHNRLLGLGDAYLEAIAIDPDAPAPQRPRWFALDHRSGPPRLSNWVLRVDDLEAACEALPGSGRIAAFARGALRWRMAVPEDGSLPFAGVQPALIAWETAPPALPESGLRLAELVLSHPEAGKLEAALAPLLADARVRFAQGAPALAAAITGPDGPRRLQ